MTTDTDALPLPSGVLVDDGGPRSQVLDDLLRSLQTVAAGQSELKRLFESRLQSDEVQATAVEQLYSQLQDYKGNFIRQAIVPVLKDVIHCYDFVSSEIGHLSDSPEAAGKVAESLAHIEQMLLDVLFKHDVEPFRGEDDSFDRLTQQCVVAVPTTVAADDRKVAARRLSGFRDGAAILRKEHVSVYKFTPEA